MVIIVIKQQFSGGGNSYFWTLEIIPDWPSGNYYKCEVTAKAIEENRFKLCISTTSVFSLTGPNSSLVLPTPHGLLSFMYVCLCNCPCACTHSPMDVGKASLELALQAVLSSPVWVLEMNSGPVEKQYMLLNYWAMSPALVFFFLFYPVLVGLTKIPDFLVLKMANSTLELVIAIWQHRFCDSSKQ